MSLQTCSVAGGIKSGVKSNIASDIASGFAFLSFPFFYSPMKITMGLRLKIDVPMLLPAVIRCS